MSLELSNSNSIHIFKKSSSFKKKTKIENRHSKFCAEFDADSKTVLVFFLALIVFDFYSFEGSKTHFTGEANVYIYAYIEYY